MTNNQKLKIELEILEGISKTESLIPDWLGSRTAEDEILLTENFAGILIELLYPLEGLRMDKKTFREAFNFFVDFFQLNRDKRYSYYRISEVQDIIILSKFGSGYRPNLQFITWLERERPGYRNKLPRFMQIPPEKPRWGSEITWYDKDLGELQEMYNFQLEEFVIPEEKLELLSKLK